jgi:hypothetical protein
MAPVPFGHVNPDASKMYIPFNVARVQEACSSCANADWVPISPTTIMAAIANQGATGISMNWFCRVISSPLIRSICGGQAASPVVIAERLFLPHTVYIYCNDLKAGSKELIVTPT